VPLNQEASTLRVADGQVHAAFEQLERHFFVMVDDVVFADPIEGGHDV